MAETEAEKYEVLTKIGMLSRPILYTHIPC
jgi:hypothetical protein